MAKDRIAIVGAGVSGMALGLGLLRAGRSVRIFEQAPELGDVGAGLSISPNASLGLGYLDMIDFMDATANKPVWQYTHHGETDEVLVAFDRRRSRDQYGAEYYQIHRADFHAELVRRIRELDDDCIRLSHKLSALEETAAGYRLTFENGVEEEVSALVGADGLRSVVRDALFEADTPEFTGHMAWRALIPAGDLPDWYSEPASHVWIGPGKTAVCYPVRDDKIVNFVGMGRADAWVQEGWSVKAEPGEIPAAFEGWHKHPSDLVHAVPEETAFRWGLFARKPLDTMVKGRAALIGDAGHPMLPWFGQGASSSIEDAVVMARCFEADADPAAAFKRYNKARLKRVTTLQRESNLGGERLQAMDPYSLKNQPVKNEDALGIFRYNPATAPI